LRIDDDRVSFARRGMAATLNGIAQGYVTDRVADLLRNEGMTSVLVDMGEVFAMGRHPDGRPWRVGLPDSGKKAGSAATLEVADSAVATSASHGTNFDPIGRFGHIFDPLTGRCMERSLSVTVTAPDATTADALSTALVAIPVERVPAMLSEMPRVTARITRMDGAVITAN
jgi:thiamine biosynthesis lipoprotein